ncbi:uncharacterized protein [Leptinotarsa decemlineata]|uniref:uncharacterized protein n=1 Tax=Leptinotarsa decemlineata TaxID=7539 RepID=UPI003D307249
MYRQVLIHPEQRSLQRILWRRSPDNPISVYELNTVTYGEAASSFLAIRCLFQLATENESAYPQAADIIRKNFYVDDLLFGRNSIEKAARLCKDVSSVLKSGCFELRKFYSNNPKVLQYVRDLQHDLNVVDFGINENAKTLGLAWLPNTDMLVFKINIPDNKNATKRTILSCISTIFDPLGLLSPVTITSKIIMQKLWLEKLDWDELLPTNLESFWSEFKAELSSLNHVQIARHVLCKNPKRVEMHGFCDASQSAYGASIYMRSVDQDDGIHVNLLCSKAKVAPLHTITIPRLELNGALMLSRLAEKVSDALDTNIDRRIFWADSTIVLGWLKTPPNQLKVFVANRVAEIQQKTSSMSWHHICSGDNPSDLLSIGVKPAKLVSCSLWWHGPSWLMRSENEWPVTGTDNIKDLPELKRIVSSFHTANKTKMIDFEKFSNINRLERCMAYILKFINNAKRTRGKQTLPITLNNLKAARNELIKLAQRESFPNELKKLKTKMRLESGSSILSLNPFLDEEEIIRVGGRIANSKYPYSKRFPIILSHKHHFTKLLFNDEHKRLLHAGPQQLLYSIREAFWSTSGRSIARKTVRQCIKCFRNNPTLVQPIMGNLPSERLEPQPPFYICRVDYAGPLMIKNKKGRGSKLSKCYVSLFICFVTKAIHLELVSDLTKDSFILALRRFVARRGKPLRIFSDNGKNFVSANSELAELGKFIQSHELQLTESFSIEGIE